MTRKNRVILMKHLIKNPFTISIFLTGVAFFVTGALKSRFVIKSWYSSGFKTLFIGGVAAIIAYYVAVVLKNLI